MDESMLLRGVLGSVFGGRRKRGRRALRHLTPGIGTILSHPTAVLTAAGVAWGIFETLQNRGTGSLGSTGTIGSVGTGSAGATGSPGSQPLPPLPDLGAAGVSPDVLRLVRLAVSAASADGAMSDEERAAVLAHAREAGVDGIVAAELANPRPLAEIVVGVTDPAQRATLYGLAFTVLRADEAVNGAERIYLASLAHQLNLDPQTVQTIEADTAARIDKTE